MSMCVCVNVCGQKQENKWAEKEPHCSQIAVHVAPPGCDCTVHSLLTLRRCQKRELAGSTHSLSLISHH